MLTSMIAVMRLRGILLQPHGGADADRNGDQGRHHQHQGRTDHGAQQARQLRLGRVALGEQGGVEVGAHGARGLHPVQPVHLLIGDAALILGLIAGDLALQIHLGVVRQRRGDRHGLAQQAGLARDHLGGLELQLRGQQGLHGRGLGSLRVVLDSQAADLLLGDDLLEIGALRIGTVDPRRVHVDRQGHGMSVEGGVALGDDAAQQDHQEGQSHADGRTAVPAEAGLTRIAGAQAAFQTLGARADAGRGRGGVSHTVPDRLARCAWRRCSASA